MPVSYPSDVAKKLAIAIPDNRLPHLEHLVEALFFASFLREEGQDLAFNIVYPGVFDVNHPTPERVHGWEPWHVVDFAIPEPLNPSSLAKYALLAGGDGEYLVVHCFGEELMITGVGYLEQLRWFNDKLLTVRVAKAGVLRVFYGANEVVSYASGNIDPLVRWPFVSPRVALGDVVMTLGAMIDIETDKRALASGALHMLSSELIRRGHGGIIAILGKDDVDIAIFGAQKLKAPLEFGSAFVGRWEASMVEGSTENPDDDLVAEAERAATECARSLSVIGRMTTVDGAVLATPALAIVGFRAKLPAPDVTPPVLKVNADGSTESIDMMLKGTRHRSAACFVEQAPRRIALIASADGPAAAMFQDDAGKVLYWPVRDSYGIFSL
jgi:hypothetical protein